MNDAYYTRCDFCSEATTELKHYEPLKHVTFVRAGDAVAEVEDIGPWCACKACAELIDLDKWNELMERALIPLRTFAFEEGIEDKLRTEAILSMWTVVFGERVKL